MNSVPGLNEFRSRSDRFLFQIREAQRLITDFQLPEDRWRPVVKLQAEALRFVGRVEDAQRLEDALGISFRELPFRFFADELDPLDIEAIVRLQNECKSQGLIKEADTVESLTSKLESQDGSIFILLKQAGKLIGFCHYYPILSNDQLRNYRQALNAVDIDDRTQIGLLNRLLVSPEHLQTGADQLILDSALWHAKDSLLKGIITEVPSELSENEMLAELLRKNGFVPKGDPMRPQSPQFSQPHLLYPIP